MASEKTVYCVCRQPYDGDNFMIECDVCRDWFHGDCVGIKEHQASDIEIYHCPNCQLEHGPLRLKKRRNLHRHDYSELDDRISKAVQTGTSVFVRDLKNRAFPSADEVPILRKRGFEVNMELLEETGFKVPIIVDCKDGLDLTVPPPTFTIQDVENHVGSMREIDVIDVSRQEDCKMLMREWTEYYSSTNRSKVYNVISLEFSKTKLAGLVEPPRIVRELSWVNNCWPEEFPGDQIQFERPLVQRYCLMGVKDSYTDFHVDFGGTSVWYHVLRGEKVFYLIRPTDFNLELYERWVSSSNQGEMFFGDQVDKCYKCVVKQGQTLFIPTGWIHAVLTPIDSLVFGGNFLHNFHIGLQIRVYEIEKSVGTPAKYLFPNFETIHWYAARAILEIIKELQEDGKKVQDYLAQGSKCLAEALKSWTHKKDLTSRSIIIRREGIPDTIQYGKLLKELQKVVKHFQMPKDLKLNFKGDKKDKDQKKEQKKRKKKTTQLTPKDKANVDALHAHTQRELDLHTWDAAKLASSMSRPGGQVPTSQMSNPLYPQATAAISFAQLQHQLSSPTKPLTSPVMSPGLLSHEGSMLSTTSSSMHESSLEGDQYIVSAGGGPEKSDAVPLKVRILQPDEDDKKDISVYDFDEEEKKDNVQVSPIGTKTSILGSPTKSPSAQALPFRIPTSPGSAGVKLKLNMGKILGGGIGSAESHQQQQQPFGMFPPLTGSPFMYTPGVASLPKDVVKDEDSDDEHLVVDDAPKRPRQRTLSDREMMRGGPPGPGAESGSLRMKLSLGKYQEPMTSSHNSTMSSLDSSYISSGHESSSSADISPVKIPYRSPPHFPIVPQSTQQSRPGYNGSIADILEASGYNSGNEFKVDDQIGNASPSMRDAIQGMLTMSQMGNGDGSLGSSINPGMSMMNNPDPFEPRPRPAIRLQREQQALKRKAMVEDESGERMPTCYKDDEYVYPTLDLSDNEDEHVFKPRGRMKKDETWNPKAKLHPNCPKPERPMREGVRRESVESGLAAAAARLANQPPAKRQYIRKKPKKPKMELSMSQSYSSFSSWPYDSEPGTSGALSISAPASSLQSALSKSKEGPKDRKPKKGMATAKQRLGKILKLHKIMK